jgi:hypothetical protein
VIGTGRERRPAPGEFAPFYAGYVAAVPEGDILATLEREGLDFVAELRALAPDRAAHRYGPGKWTIAEVVAHVADAERVFAYRALRFGRGDATPLPGFEQDLWVPASHAGSRPFADLVDELEAVRAVSLHLFRSFEPEDWDRTGEASGLPVSVRGLAWIVAGHALHHRRILAERYGLGG